jgi:hypothetical protein
MAESKLMAARREITEQSRASSFPSRQCLAGAILDNGRRYLVEVRSPQIIEDSGHARYVVDSQPVAGVRGIFMSHSPSQQRKKCLGRSISSLRFTAIYQSLHSPQKINA